MESNKTKPGSEPLPQVFECLRVPGMMVKNVFLIS